MNTPSGSRKTVLYASLGAELMHFDVDVEQHALTRHGSVALPANVQYAWPHGSKKYLYVASSDRTTGGKSKGTTHHLTAFRIDPSGALQPHGNAVPLRDRPIHVTVDADSRHALVAYCSPARLTVHRLGDDGTIDEEVSQRDGLDFGTYPHQVRVAPSNRTVVVVDRGLGKQPATDPGGLKVFRYRDGLLGEEVSITPDGGRGFDPRHLDFHLSRPWVYVSLERNHKLCLFRLEDGTLSDRPVFSKETLADAGSAPRAQAAGTVHLHPREHMVYVAERASGAGGGENSILCYAIDADTGEPTLVQRAPTHGTQPRTFSIDESGRILVAANTLTVPMEGGKVLPASLDVFLVRDDGRLAHVRKYDFEAPGKELYWCGMMTL